MRFFVAVFSLDFGFLLQFFVIPDIGNVAEDPFGFGLNVFLSACLDNINSTLKKVSRRVKTLSFLVYHKLSLISVKLKTFALISY